MLASTHNDYFPRDPECCPVTCPGIEQLPVYLGYGVQDEDSDDGGCTPTKKAKRQSLAGRYVPAHCLTRQLRFLFSVLKSHSLFHLPASAITPHRPRSLGHRKCQSLRLNHHEVFSYWCFYRQVHVGVYKAEHPWPPRRDGVCIQVPSVHVGGLQHSLRVVCRKRGRPRLKQVFQFRHRRWLCHDQVQDQGQGQRSTTVRVVRASSAANTSRCDAKASCAEV